MPNDPLALGQTGSPRPGIAIRRWIRRTWVSAGLLFTGWTKLSGTQDCVADSEAVAANARLLPPSTEFLRIDGANHAQFGWYGTQLGDCRATITRAARQARTNAVVLQVLAKVAGAP